MGQKRFDKQVRHYIYDSFVKTGQAPTREHCAQAFSCQEAEIQAAFQRLAEERALVLQSTGEVLMAEPFSAVPTAFLVEVGNQVLVGKSYLGCPWHSCAVAHRRESDDRLWML